MKILYLTSSLDRKTGWGRYASDLMDSMRARGHVVKAIEIRNRGLSIISSAWRVRRLLSSFDIIHALDGNPLGIVAWLASRGIAKKLIISIVGSYSIAPLYNWKTRWLMRRAYQSAHTIVSISSFTSFELQKKIPSLRPVVIPPGINFAMFHQPHRDASEFYVLSVGTVEERKGYHISIQAFQQAKKKIPHLKYVIVGKRPLDFHVADVSFCEHISDAELQNLYASAKLFILTSVNVHHHFEGFGIVFLEAASAGLPVIGTLGNGIEDAVANGINGILVPQGDVQATADAIVTLLSDKPLWDRMSSESIKWAGRHDLAIIAEQWEHVYE